MITTKQIEEYKISKKINKFDKRKTCFEKRKHEIQLVINKVKETEFYTYKQVGDILGVSKERVRQLIKFYELEDYKTSRIEIARKKLLKMIDDGSIYNQHKSTLFGMFKNTISQNEIESILEQHSISLEFCKPKLVLALEIALKQGFDTKDYKVKEILNYLNNNTEFEFTMLKLRNELWAYGIPYKRTYKKKTP